MEQELKIIKHGVTIPISHEDIAVGREMRWEFVSALFDSRYKRKIVSKTWVPVNEETLAKFKELEVRLSEIEDELYELGAERENGGYWEAPTGHFDIEYAETEEEWYDRCIELDKA